MKKVIFDMSLTISILIIYPICVNSENRTLSDQPRKLYQQIETSFVCRQNQHNTEECELDDEAQVTVLIDPFGRCKIDGMKKIFASYKEMVKYVESKMFPGKKVVYFDVLVKTLE